MAEDKNLVIIGNREIQKIAMVIQNGDYKTAGFWVMVIMVIAFIVVLLMNLLGSGKNKQKKQW